MMARLSVTCLLFIAVLTVDRSQSASMRKRDAAEEQVDGDKQHAFIALPGGSNLNSGSEGKRDLHSILAQIGLIKRNDHGDSSMKHQYQRRSDDDTDAETLPRYRLFPQSSSTPGWADPE
jgi:hypothetical protein